MLGVINHIHHNVMLGSITPEALEEKQELNLIYDADAHLVNTILMSISLEEKLKDNELATKVVLIELPEAFKKSITENSITQLETPVMQQEMQEFTTKLTKQFDATRQEQLVKLQQDKIVIQAQLIGIAKTLESIPSDEEYASKIMQAFKKARSPEYTSKSEEEQVAEIIKIFEDIKITPEPQHTKITNSSVACFRESYREVEKVDPSTKKRFPPRNTRVPRYEIEDTNTELTGAYAGKDTLHPIESTIFTAAFEELKKTKSAEEYAKLSQTERSGKPPNNVVVVDIFARDTNGNIKATKSGTPETHSVALWKKSDTEIVLIDPSNTAFSSSLLAPFTQLANEHPAGQAKLEVTSMQINKDQLYKIDEKAPEGVKKRDCIDIAVKVGLALNALQEDGIPVGSLREYMLHQISNQPPVLSKLPQGLNASENHKSFENIIGSLDSQAQANLQSANQLTSTGAAKLRDTVVINAKTTGKKTQERK